MKWSLPWQACHSLDEETNCLLAICLECQATSWLGLHVALECNRNSGHTWMVCPKFWSDCYILIYTKCWELMESRGSHGCHCDEGDGLTLCEWLSWSYDYTCCVTLWIIVLEIFLQSYRYDCTLDGSHQGASPASRQLTIFYGGQAHVYDDISPEKVSTNLSPQFALFWKLVVRPLTMSY